MSRAGILGIAWVGAVAVLGPAGPSVGELTSATGFVQQLRVAPDTALSSLAAAVAWVVLLWLAAGWLAVLGARGAGRTGRWSRRVARLLLPLVLRRLLESTVGVTVVLSAGPAVAASAAATTSVSTTAAAATSTAAASAADTSVSPTPAVLPSLDRRPTTTVELAPLPAVPAPVLATPSAPTSGPRPSPDPVLRGQLPTDRAVVVRRGDCLWSVVERALGPSASDADVARAWPRWYAANRSVVGPDAGLLLPGQRLVPPPP